MQLNTLSLNSNTTSAQTNFKLQIYDHKLINLHQHIFIFGKKIQKFSIQTSLLQLNLNPFHIKPVFNLNAPSFTQFTLFNFQSFLYFYGKTHIINQIQPKNQLYQFDGVKFTLLQLNGQINQNIIIYSSCIFNKKFVLIFGDLPDYCNQSLSNCVKISSNCLKNQPNNYRSQWYILDLQSIIIRPVFCNQSVPFSEKAQLLWLNGRGYLFLKQTYDSLFKIYQKNRLYEIKFESFSELILKCEEICFSKEIIQQPYILEHFFSFDNKSLLFMTGQHIIQSVNLQQNKQKKIFHLNLQNSEWREEPQIISIKGLNGQVICQGNSLIYVGGIFRNQLVQDIQIIYYDQTFQKFTQVNSFKIDKYQQSRCYYCEQAFTYEQKFIYSSLVQKDDDSFFIKKKIQMKFLQKLSKNFASEFQAIGMIIDFMKYLKSQQISIRLCEKFSQTKQYWPVRKKIQQQANDMLCIEGKSSHLIKLELIQQSFNNQDLQFPNNQLSDFSIEISKLKIASLNIGQGFLFVNLTEENKILVGYSSSSSTEFSQTNLKSFSIIYYTITLKKQSQKVEYSSVKNRQIIFQNVKLYFANQESYEKVELYKKLLQKKSLKLVPKSVYVLQVKNLQKRLKHQDFSLKDYEDIRIKDRKSKNPLNSLLKYLKHLYLDNFPKIIVEGASLSLKSLYAILEDYEKNNLLKLITIKDEKNSKTELEDTHFTTNQDQLHDKKADFIDKGFDVAEKITVYLIPQSQHQNIDEYYHGFFVYYEKRLVKIYKTQHKILCGTQISLINNNLSFKKQDKKLQRWLQNIELSVINENNHISEI